MTLRTYRANSMADALAEVKKDLGCDAVILHTRTYKVGGVMGLGARSIVEITASSDPRVPVRRPRAASTTRQRAVSSSGGPDRSPPKSQSSSGIAVLDDDRRGSTRPTSRPVSFDPPTRDDPFAPYEAQPRAKQPDALATATVAHPPDPQRIVEPKTPVGGIARIATRVEPAPIDAASTLVLQEELASIRRLVGQVLATSRQTALTVERDPKLSVGRTTEALSDLYLRLVDQLVAPELADELVGRVRDELSPVELREEQIVRQALLRQLEAIIPVADEPIRVSTSDAPRVIAIIGPTGVGKTTTLAKLAATAKLRAGKRVALITCDTYRIAAVEQLRTYANIIGLPLHVVMSPAEMGPAREAVADADVVLIDTPGRSQNDADRLEELRAFIEAAAPDEVHLAISCTASQPVLERTIERFAIVKPTRTILTKLDEGVAFGTIANIAHLLTSTITAPIGHVTTGQEVPDHIEVARADRLARLVLDGLATTAP